MMRRMLLWLSEREWPRTLMSRTALGRSVAGRFVAGETLADAVAAARTLSERGISATLDLLGESVVTEEATRSARDEVVRTLEALGSAGLEPNVSIKLTQLGLDIDEGLCRDNVRAIVERARDLGGFVRLDMESSAYTERTLRLFACDLFPEFGSHVGVVIQSYLRRARADVEMLIELGARVRLCKGAYAEPEHVAFPKKRDVDRNFAELMELLLERGRYPAIATHDERLIEHAIRFCEANGLAAGRFEFQMLYGVRRDLQARLQARGYNVRVYIPFGTAWYPYFMRRLAERPANVAFMLGSVRRELFRRR